VSDLPRIGFLGVGAMGNPMVRSLLSAGYPVTAYDTARERLDSIALFGATPASAGWEAVMNADVVCASLPSSDAFVEVAETVLLPGVREGQVVIDFGTTTPPETRRIAERLAAKGVSLVEAPLSGGEAGAQKAKLRTFGGGDRAAFERVRPILIAVGGEENLVYCGPTGAGQIAKGVNQLAMGLGAAAYLEAVAFGVRAGVDPSVLVEAVGAEGAEPWRTMVARMAKAADEGRAHEMGVKFRELPYFLREAEEAGLPLPLTRALYDFCDSGQWVVIDDNRPAPSFWWELVRGRD